MTTKHSPISALRAQADHIASMLKAAERGDKIDVRFAEKIAAARANESFTVGIVMDDKIIKLEMPWTVISGTDQAGLSEYILDQMRETRDAIN